MNRPLENGRTGRFLSFGQIIVVDSGGDVPWTDIYAALPTGAENSGVNPADLHYVISHSGPGEPQYRLSRNGSLVILTDSMETILLALQTDAAWQVARACQEWMFIHSGAVAIHGRSALLPGISGAGKSSLVAALLELGAHYYSDEYAPIDAHGLLYPFPCPLKFKEQDGGVRRVSPQSLGVDIETAPARVDTIFFPTYVPGARVKVTPMAPGEVALSLLQHMPASRRYPERALETAAVLTKHALGFSIQHGSSTGAAQTIGQSLADL